ncbi:uncharacterized protein LOC130712389 [Lotus japonicus]|uniref:uncharacterized protein LOC130712389 n=1 Tax=Lotus japonicus TaxID=34305 RepID=UPI002588BD3E|nr:uncharacterized protein LOC130712389 [Lotus japonicus]
MYSGTATEIWQDLRERFAQKNGPRVFQLRRELMSLNQGSDSVSVYYTKLKTIWDELLTYKPVVNCICGAIQPLIAHAETEHVMSFLMGLNDSFSQVRGTLLLMDPIPPINKVFSLVIQEEKQREVSNGAGSSATTTQAFAATASSQGGSPAKCFKLHGYPPGMKPKSKPSTHAVADQSSGTFQNAVTTLSPAQCNQLIQLLTNQLTTTSPDSVDVPESSGTKSATVTLPNKTHISVQGIGTVHLTPSLVLHNDSLNLRMIGKAKPKSGLYYRDTRTLDETCKLQFLSFTSAVNSTKASSVVSSFTPCTKSAYFFGLEIARSKAGIFLNQRKYTLSLLEDTGFLGAQPTTLPMQPHLKLNSNDGDLLPDATQYRRLVGRLLYLTLSRPDITFCVHKLSQFLSQPRTSHLDAVHYLLRYLKGTPGQGVFFSSTSSLKLHAFSDADWATCPDTRWLVII